MKSSKHPEENLLSSIERLAIGRHPQRPKALDVIHHVFDRFEEIHGDRLFGDDHAMITGFAYIDGQKCIVIAQEKGTDTESRVFRNFGMPYPEGYRKALRVMKIAEKFELPIVTLIDTPGAFPCLEAEERGQGWAIAENLKQMSGLKTPSIALILGEGCSGGALGIGVCDRIVMCQHAYYSVISPEGCASILWKDGQKKDLAAKALKLHPEDLEKLDIIDAIIEEPVGGAHHDVHLFYSRIKTALLEHLESLKYESTENLLVNRYEKYRKIGKYLEL